MNYSHTAAEATVVRGNTELVLCERNMLNIVTGIISVVVDNDDGATTMMLRNHCHISTTKPTLSTVSTTSANHVPTMLLIIFGL